MKYRMILKAGFITLAITILWGCMSIPSSIVDPENWFQGLPENHDSATYKGPWDGNWLNLITAKPDELEKLMIIDLAGDPVYKTLELQLLRREGEAYGVALAARKDGGIDYYYQPTFPMTEERLQALSALLTKPSFYKKDFDYSLEVTGRGLKAMLDLIDAEGRRIYFNIREDQKDRKLTGILAPVSDHAEEPESFPLVYLDDYSMVLVKNTDIIIEIDGIKRKPVIFPIIVDGQRVYYGRYSSRVVIADLIPEGDYFLPAEGIESSTALLKKPGTEYHLSWNGGHPELTKAVFETGNSTVELEFYPALPNLPALVPGVSLEGKFILSVNSVKGVIGGEYSIETEDQQILLKLQPRKGWQPPGMSRTPWVSTFLYEAVLIPVGGGVKIKSNWSRINR